MQNKTEFIVTLPLEVTAQIEQDLRRLNELKSMVETLEGQRKELQERILAQYDFEVSKRYKIGLVSFNVQAGTISGFNKKKLIEKYPDITQDKEVFGENKVGAKYIAQIK